MKNKVYIVSGYYILDCDSFETDNMPTSIHVKLEEANTVCENTFKDFVENDAQYLNKTHDFNIEESIDENGAKSFSACDYETIGRVIYGVTILEM